MSKNFRLPRKEKKRLKKMGILTYPLKNDGYLMAHPAKNEIDYIAYKKGKLIDLFSLKNSNSNIDELDKEIFIDDEKLKEYVFNIIVEGYKGPSLCILLQAKNHNKAKIAYFNFINAYHKVQEGDNSYGNICCLSIDLAKKLLK